jgi:hypothetical protein
MEESVGSGKAKRRADRATLLAYHEARLAELLDRVREGFARYDAGEIDAFELDDLIHHYKKATQKLWSFCAVSGESVERHVRLLEWQAAEGERTDWWELGAPRRR